MISVKEFAEQQGCSETIIYRHLRTYAEELGETVVKDHGKTWLKPEACDILRSKMKPKASMRSPGEDPKIQELQDEIERLKQGEKEKEELYSVILKSAAQMTETLREENRLLREENNKVLFLQADNEAIRRQANEEKERAEAAERKEKEISSLLSEAKEQLKNTETVAEINAQEASEAKKRAEAAEQEVLDLKEEKEFLLARLEEVTKEKRNFFQRISDKIEKFFTE